VVDRKYNTILCKLAQRLYHPKREEETTLGNLIADSFADTAQSQVMMVGSGSIISKELGPVVTLKDLLSCFPYDDNLTRFEVTGDKLKQIFSYVMRTENRNSEGECYQINSRVQAIYDDSYNDLVSLKIDMKPVSNKENYTLCLQGYHVSNSDAYLNIRNEELFESRARPRGTRRIPTQPSKYC
jgi:5'-nucleotidase